MTHKHRRGLSVTLALAMAVGVAACEPSDRTPGLWLSGEVVDPLPSDWGFTGDHREIAIEVSTPYLVPHSVTIWCASLDGDLYLGARDPESKNWPSYVDSNPDVVLKIGDSIYEARLEKLDDQETIAALQPVYAEKYELPARDPSAPITTRYWKVVPRSS